MNQIQTEVIFINLLRQVDEFILSILGLNPSEDAGSFRKRVSTLFETFKADKAVFIASSLQLGFLATLLKEYSAFVKPSIEQIGTPEILIGQIRWDDIYDKPDVLAASSDWADITNKPATFAPSAHGHAYSEITDKPATFAPSAHGHAYSEITDKPATFAPSAHGHAYSEITDKPATFPHDEVTWSEVTNKPATMPGHVATLSYVGNGTASRVLSFTGDFTPVAIVINTGTSSYNRWPNFQITDVSNNTFTTTVSALNTSATTYNCIILG
jgi:hypothetical protein